MNCLSCGSRLKYVDGLYICENCESKQTLSAFFESTEVFICYIENDEHGRRTYDSVIAHDIYKKLEAAKIKTFYERVSADGLFGEDFEKSRVEATEKAAVLLILATTKEHFEKLLKKYQGILSEKKVIPIYSKMDAHHIPKELNSLQSVNYDSIGAVANLTKSILEILGRENEFEALQIADKKQKKRRQITLVLICAILAVVLAATSYFVFCTPYILKNKKYEYAQKIMTDGKYLDAAEIFMTLGDYKDSSDIFKKIYNRYDGYYTKDDETLEIYLNVDGKANVEIEITHFCDNKIVKANATSKIVQNTIEFYYRDSQMNQGKGKIELFDDRIRFLTEMENTNGDLTIGNHDEFFSLSGKSDAPIFRQITEGDLDTWLAEQADEDYIRGLGYELVLIETGWQDGGYLYKIKNTDIQVLIVPERVSDDQFVNRLYSYSAPASIVLPEQIGKRGDIVVKNGNLYIPFSELECFTPRRVETYTDDIVEKDTIVGVVGCDLVTDKEYFFYSPIKREVEVLAIQKYGKLVYNEFGSILCTLESENDECYLYSVALYDENSDYKDYAPLYKCNKSNFQIEFIGEAPCINNPPDFPVVSWKEHYGLAKEFPN